MHYAVKGPLIIDLLIDLASSFVRCIVQHISQPPINERHKNLARKQPLMEQIKSQNTEQEEVRAKIDKAEQLRKKYGKLLGLFFKPDYLESGELFYEASQLTTDGELKRRCILSAAETFALYKKEYGFFRAAEMYKLLVDEDKEDRTRLVQYTVLYGTSLEEAGKYMSAGNAFDEVARLLEKESYEDSVQYYNRAIALYEKDGSCPFHMRKALERCLLLLLSKNSLREALPLLKKFNVKHSKFGIQILSVFLNQQIEEELDSPEEAKLIKSLINRGDEETASLFEEFQDNNVLPDFLSIIFAIAIERMKPENNIC